MNDLPPRIRLVIFDLAGTTVDHGCFSPIAPFTEALRRHGVTVNVDEVRRFMGAGKLDHLRSLMELPDSRRGWRAAHASEATEEDIRAIFERDFVPLQLESVERESGIISGVGECVEGLRRRGIKIGTTTGYFGAAAQRCWAAAARQGFAADCNMHADGLPAGRPAPWMIFRVMETLGVYPAADVVKVGDTTVDIAEGLSAGAWTVGVTESGSEMGLREADLDALPAAERAARAGVVADALVAAGAHHVIPAVRDLPSVIAQIESGLASGAAMPASR